MSYAGYTPTTSGNGVRPDFMSDEKPLEHYKTEIHRLEQKLLEQENHLQRQALQMAERLNSRTREMMALESAKITLESQLHAILHSRSYRVTRPLRFILHHSRFIVRKLKRLARL